MASYNSKLNDCYTLVSASFQPKGGHFGRRHGWLDHIPPFSGSHSITSTCQYVVPVGSSKRAGIQSHQLLQCQKTGNQTCSCFLCNEDLLKLQVTYYLSYLDVKWFRTKDDIQL